MTDRVRPTDAAAGHEPAGGAIDVYVASPDAVLDADEARRARDLLGAEERASCEAFEHDADRRTALVTAALVRSTLSRCAPVPAGEWRFERGAHGRPEIDAPAGTGLRFNASHTRELVVCAVTHDAEIGVDVERTAPLADLALVAPTVLTPAELAAMDALPQHLRVERFYSAWTLKESYLKARGVGLALSPLAVEFDLGTPGRIDVRFAAAVADDPADWWFALFRAGPDHLLALASTAPPAPGRLSVSRVAPAGGPAARIELAVLASSDPRRTA